MNSRRGKLSSSSVSFDIQKFPFLANYTTTVGKMKQSRCELLYEDRFSAPDD